MSRNILHAPAERGLGEAGGGFPWTDDSFLSFHVLPNYLSWGGVGGGKWVCVNSFFVSEEQFF